MKALETPAFGECKFIRQMCLVSNWPEVTMTVNANSGDSISVIRHCTELSRVAELNKMQKIDPILTVKSEKYHWGLVIVKFNNM